MTDSCPFCLASPLPEGAKKCRYCGSWLSGAAEADSHDAIAREVREELRKDLAEHRGLVETMLKRLQTVAGIIVAAALGAALFFGYTTDKSISDTSAKIAENASAKIEAAASDITGKAQDEVRRVVTEKMASEETRKLIETELHTTITERVQVAVEQGMDPIKKTVGEQIQTATNQLQELDGQIADLKEQSAGASKQLSTIQASFEGAQQQTVQSAELLLPTDLIRVEEKGGPDQLEKMLAHGIDALSYQLHGYYYGPMVWRYFDALKALPQFRHVLVLSQGGDQLIGVLDASTLSAFLDPPGTLELSKSLGNDLWHTPNEADVPGWTDFARWMSDGDLERLRGLPSFRQAGEPVHLNDSTIKVLAIMEQRRADILPVVNERNVFVGVVERSHLTARILLDIAAPRS